MFEDIEKTLVALSQSNHCSNMVRPQVKGENTNLNLNFITKLHILSVFSQYLLYLTTWCYVKEELMSLKHTCSKINSVHQPCSKYISSLYMSNSCLSPCYLFCKNLSTPCLFHTPAYSTPPLTNWHRRVDIYALLLLQRQFLTQFYQQ